MDCPLPIECAVVLGAVKRPKDHRPALFRRCFKRQNYRVNRCTTMRKAESKAIEDSNLQQA